MLARVSSGSGGIKEYLETGRKKGREFERDLIDERFTLAGDIELMDMVIETMETAKEGDAKYLHITLGFAEEFSAASQCSDSQVNFEKMRQVTEAYRDALMAAYDPAEYAFYAEAHIPKVTHEVNATNGEYERRLPHVHIIIPKRNLESGRYLDPLGYGKGPLTYHDAIQEKINIDFKLKSPNDARRAIPLDLHPLARHNASIKDQSPKQIKATIAAMIQRGEIRTFDDVARFASAYGEVKLRHGKDGDYLNVKPTWADKGINLKEFSRAAMRQSAPTDFRLNLPGVSNDKPDYAHLNTEQVGRTQRAAAGLRQPDFARTGAAPGPLIGLRNLSSLDLVQDRAAAQSLLQPDAPHRVGRSGAADPAVRWPRAGADGVDGRAGPIEPDFHAMVRHWRERASLEVRYVASPAMRRAFKAMQEGERVAFLQDQVAQTRSRIHSREQGAAEFGLAQADEAIKGGVAAKTGIPITKFIHQRLLAAIKEIKRGRPRIDKAAGQDRRGATGDSSEVSFDHGSSRSTQRGGHRGQADPVVGAAEGRLGQDHSALGGLGDASGTGRRQALLGRASAAIAGSPTLADLAQKIRRFVAYRHLDKALATAIRRLRADKPQDQISPTVIDTLEKQRQSPGISAAVLKRDTSPSIVLNEAVKRYGLNAADYSVGSGRDGTPRILHADKQYNLGDFFTKHVGISWEQAKPVLQECYYATLSDALPPPDKALWRAFSEWREQAYQQRRNTSAAGAQALRAGTLAVRNEYKAARLGISGQPAKLRRVMLAEARAKQLVNHAKLAQMRADLTMLRKAPSRNAQYRSFLTELASKGDLAALGELRRLAPVDNTEEDRITGTRGRVALALPSYRIDHHGKVTYLQGARALVCDSVNGVAVLSRDVAAYDTALKVAVARYGVNLTFTGDDLFMKNMTAAARKSGLDLTIRNGNAPGATTIPVRQQGPER